jgi:hypothetical protein
VESDQTTSAERLSPFQRVYLEFILRRVVHDLGNSISGINSLSDYHLRSGVSDSALEESLTLIRESAEASRDLLVMVGDLLQPAEAEEEIVHVQTLLEEVAKIISLLLPRSVNFETGGNQHTDAVISVLRGQFFRKILAVIAMDVNELRVPKGSIYLGWVAEGKQVLIQYRSTLPSSSALREQAPALLANLSKRAGAKGVVEGDTFLLTMTFPQLGNLTSQGPREISEL